MERVKIASGVMLWVSVVAVSAGQAKEHFFTAPEAPFISGAKEAIANIEITGGMVAAAQSLIDHARQAKPDAMLVIRLSGTLTVSGAPLRLGSRMCLVMAKARKSPPANRPRRIPVKA